MVAETGSRGLLAVFAHPDDESFGAGGTLALVAATGEPVSLICTTNGDEGGEAGDDGDHAMDPEIRREELRCACAALGVNPPIFLGYRDSGMETWVPKPGALALADRTEVIGRIAAEIRRLRPAVVLTFDPGGIYGHPDHVATSQAASAAFHVTASEPGGPRALYHLAFPRSWAESLVAGWTADAARPDAPAPTADDLLQRRRILELAPPDEQITTWVDVRPVLDRKLAAVACHRSQISAEELEREEQSRDEAYATETFIRVDPAPPPGARETFLAELEPAAAG